MHLLFMNTIRRVLLLSGLILASLVPSMSAAQSSVVTEALRLEAQGRIAEAERAWQSVVQSNPESPEALVHLGLLEAHEQRYPQAVGFYLRALAKAPNLPGLETNLGLAYFKNGQFADALKPFADELKRHPGDPRLTLLLGMTHYGMADYLVAVPFLKRGAQQDPQNLPLRLTLAHSCLWSRQYECVWSTYTEILSLNPSSAEAEMLVGEALDETGDDMGAIKHFRAAAVSNPKEPNVYFGLGYLLWTQSHYSEAAQSLTLEIANDPQHGQAHAYLGDCFVQLNQYADAEPELRLALQIDPQSPVAHRDLGIVYAATGRTGEAETELNRAIALDPEDTIGRYRRARLFQSLGRRDEAAADFKAVGAMKQQQNDALIKKLASKQVASRTP